MKYTVGILKSKIIENNSWKTGSDYGKENKELQKAVKILEKEDEIMNVEKIILDELKKYPYIRSGFDKPALKDIAKSIAARIEDELASRKDVPDVKDKIRRTLCGMVYLTAEENAKYAYDKVDEYTSELFEFIEAKIQTERR